MITQFDQKRSGNMEVTRTINNGVGENGATFSDVNERIATLDLEITNLAGQAASHRVPLPTSGNLLYGTSGTVWTSGTKGAALGISTTGLVYFDSSTGALSTIALPSSDGLLYYTASSGSLSYVGIPSSGLLTGNTTSFGSESYYQSGGYFLY